jgi:hypothetical protein
VTASLAIGDRALWDLPRGVAPPAGVALTTGPEASSDGPPQPLLVDQLLREALAGPTVRVPADPARRELSFGEVVARLRPGAGSPELDYAVDLGPHLRLIVLDLVRRRGGSGGLVRPDQPRWLAGQLAAAQDRWVVVVSHQPLAASDGGTALLALLDRSSRVIATLSGHTHRTWMLDHVFRGRIGEISRELSYIDAQGGRPKGFIGTRLDRNVVLHRAPPP